jgi:hypothetical protein
VSTLLHATVYMLLHNLLNVLVQIANEMGLQKKKKLSVSEHHLQHNYGSYQYKGAPLLLDLYNLETELMCLLPHELNHHNLNRSDNY